MRFLLVIAIIFILLALYFALRHPNGKVFPTRCAKLLRKVGPLVQGSLEDLAVRFLARAGGVIRVFVNVTYSYEVGGTPHTITLPTDSLKLGGPKVREAITAQEYDREVPETLTLENGLRLEGREAIRSYFLERALESRPTVEVLYDRSKPAVSTVRDWA